MNNFFELIKDTTSLHHAYFFVGDIPAIKEDLVDFLEKRLKILVHGNPDFKVLDFNNLNVEDAKSIREASEKRNFNGEMVFLITFESISIEAQNSLLKTLEEPTEKTHFFFVSPQDTLLPTLKSRMVVVKFQISNFKSQKEESILELNLRGRLERVKEIVDSISDEDSTKQDAINFVNEIESELYERGVIENSEELISCQKARMYLLDRGAPTKMILENLVLSI